MSIVLVLLLVSAAGPGSVDESGCVGPQDPGVPATSPASRLVELQWEAKQPLPTARFGPGVAAEGGLVYCVGGYGGTRLTTNEVYDPAGDSWFTKAPMDSMRNGCAGAAAGGRVYIVGGYNGVRRLDLVEEYDPAGEEWRSLTPMLYERTVPAAVGLEGKLYVVGGFTGDTLCPFPRTVERYDPATATWDTVAPMPTGRSGPGAAVLDGKLYVCGGWIGTEPTLTTVEMYDPAGDSWTTLAPMPTGRMYLAATASSGYLFALGGQLTFNGPQVDIVEAYDPRTNSWSTSTAMPIARGSLGAATVDGSIYSVAGYNAGSIQPENYRGEVQSALAEQRPATGGKTALGQRVVRRGAMVHLPTVGAPAAPVAVFDARGKRVRELDRGADWDCRDARGVLIPAGVYLCRAESAGVTVRLVVVD
jgi:N-acetylneuraminic acid mutarotase